MEDWILALSYAIGCTVGTITSWYLAKSYYKKLWEKRLGKLK